MRNCRIDIAMYIWRRTLQNKRCRVELSIVTFDPYWLPSSVQRLAALAPPCLSGFVPRAEPTPRLSSSRYRGSVIFQNGSSCTQSSGLCPNVEGWRQGESKVGICLYFRRRCVFCGHASQLASQPQQPRQHALEPSCGQFQKTARPPATVRELLLCFRKCQGAIYHYISMFNSSCGILTRLHVLL